MPRTQNKPKTRLERERLRAKLTQMDLARLAKVAQSTISKLEADQMPRPGYGVLASLAWALQRCGRKIGPADLQPGRQLILAAERTPERKSRKRETAAVVA